MSTTRSTNTPEAAPEISLSDTIPAFAPPEKPARWGLARRIAFRFGFVYLVLYYIPTALDAVPVIDRAAVWLINGWIFVVRPIARVLHAGDVGERINRNSGDTTFHYVQLLCYVAIAAAATIAWSIADRRRPAHPRLYEVLRVYLRYVLAITMLGYGMAKVLQLQFPFPSDVRLAETYADSSPMGFLWRFMGYSAAYSTFAGAAEVLGAALLFFRRTATLGALITAGVMTNVVLLNFCFDVPVKLLSSHLLLVAVILAAHDARRIFDFFVLQRPTRPARFAWTPRRRWARYLRRGLKLAVIGCALYGNIAFALEARAKYALTAGVKHPLEGIYDVEEGPAGWRRVGFEGSRGLLIVRLVDGAQRRFRFGHDAAKNTITVTPLDAAGLPLAPVTLSLTRPDAGHLLIEGQLPGEPVRVRLRRLDLSKSLLLTRGFHWVNDSPLNR